MKASELRIGNLVTLSEETRKELWDNQIIAYNNYFKVEVIYSDGDIVLELDDESVDVPDKDILGIPLTEEWFLKFGFQRHDEGSVSIQFSYGTNPVTQDYLIYLKWIKDYENKYQLKGLPFYQNGHFEIKTVHQLQNLVNALCGEELELKEPFGKS